MLCVTGRHRHPTKMKKCVQHSTARKWRTFHSTSSLTVWKIGIHSGAASRATSVDILRSSATLRSLAPFLHEDGRVVREGSQQTHLKPRRAPHSTNPAATALPGSWGPLPVRNSRKACSKLRFWKINLAAVWKIDCLFSAHRYPAPVVRPDHGFSKWQNGVRLYVCCVWGPSSLSLTF